MKLDFCCVCGIKTDLHQHHIEPVIFSGKKRIKSRRKFDSNKPLKDCNTFEIFSYLYDEGFISDEDTITVCSYHHNIMHGIMKYQKANHSEMIKESLKKAREKGIVLGRPTKLNKSIEEEALELRNDGMPIKKIAKQLNLGIGTLYKILPKEYAVDNSVDIQ